MIGAVALMPAVAQLGVPALIEIAAGTPFATVVYDARPLGPWSVRSAVYMKDRGRAIFYHHTGGGLTGKMSVGRALAEMREMSGSAPYGLPYNFIVMPTAPYRVFYLNDVDGAWPHTLNYNYATAIAAWGNYSTVEPSSGMARRMLRLGDALATMWGQYVPEYQHKDVSATECPGTLLSPLLRR